MSEPTRPAYTWTTVFRLDDSEDWHDWSTGHRTVPEVLAVAELMAKIPTIAEIRFDRITTVRERFSLADLGEDGDVPPAVSSPAPADRTARWEAAAHAAGREVDRNALAVYMAVADAEQAELRREHAERLDHIEGALARIRDRAEVVQVRVRRVLAFAEQVVATSGPGPAGAVQAVIDRLGAAVEEQPASDPSRLAGEARDERETQAAQPKRPPMDPVHILGIGAPAAVAQQSKEADGDRIVAYQSPGGTALFCTRHRDGLSPYWPPVFSEDLPDGGICAHSTCGADLLIPQQPEAAEGAQQ
jgi:hypothetical protein